MLPLILLIPGVYVLWQLAKRAGQREALGMGAPDPSHYDHGDIAVAVEEALSRRGHAIPRPVSRLLPALPPSPLERPEETGTVASYMEHLHECAMAAAALNLVRPAAINADMQALAQAPHEAVLALAALSQPMDTLTVQRDLNVLGAMPPVPETGHRDAQTTLAIKGLQEQFRQAPTGIVDPATAVAIRYAVGVIHGQNQMQMGQP
jgi:Putative peptidoglycan binding domain